MEYSQFAFDQDENDTLEQVLSDMYVTDFTYCHQLGLTASNHLPNQQLTAYDFPPNPDPDPSRSRRFYSRISPASAVTEIKRPIVPLLHTSSTSSSSEGATPADQATESPHKPDHIKQRRRERRKETNRAAQRAFRLRKDEAIREGLARLQELENKITRLRSQNGDLSDAVSDLQAEVLRLQMENAALAAESPTETDAWSSNSAGEMTPRASMELKLPITGLGRTIPIGEESPWPF